jgi:O-antigen/teichoic acid export membrane protein
VSSLVARLGLPGTSSSELLRSSYSLLANTAVTAILGVGFWVVATRLYSTVTVGRDSVLITVMVELSTLCQLNLGNGIIRFLPDLGPRTARALGSIYGLTALVALTVGAIFVVVAPSVSHELSYFHRESGLALLFVAALIVWGVFTLQDAALTATRQAPWIPLENGVFGLLKLGVLPVLLAVGFVDGVFVAWVLSMALLLVPVNLFIFKRAVPAHVGAGERRPSITTLGRRRVVRFLAQNYLASVFTQATLTVLPILVIAILGARQSAYFAIPFMIVVAFDTFASSACSALIVEATLEPTNIAALTRVFVRRVLSLVAPITVVLALAAPLVLLPFGHSYAEHGAGVLRLLLCASLLRVVLALFSALCRIDAHGVRLTLVELALLLLALGGAIPLAHSHGIDGVALAWLGANAIVAFAVVPLLLAELRRD